MRKCFMCAVAAVIMSAACLPLYASEKPLYAGVLTRIHNDWQNADYVKAYVLFKKQGHDWVAMPNGRGSNSQLDELHEKYPGSLTWSVLYKGQKIASITGIKPRKIKFYSELGSQLVSSELSKIPFRIDGKENFVSWQGPFTARPLALVSGRASGDPDKWKNSDLTPKELEIARDLYHRLVPLLPNCDEESGDIVGNNSYPADKIILWKSYRSGDNTVLAGLFVDDSDSGCEVTPDEYLNHWFILKKNKIKYIGLGMVPIDAGDFDGDGHSEWLFASGGDGVDSYILFYDNFKKHARFDIFYN